MKQKRVFEQHEQVKPFLVKVKHACAWVNENHARFGINHEVHDSTISRALLGREVYPGVVDALVELYRIAFDDPWSLCEPPAFEDMTEYAFLPWWHDVLQPDVPLNTWNLIKKRPLAKDREVEVRAKYDAWVARLRSVCDEHKQNAALVRAFSADIAHRERPNVQEWVERDGALHRAVPYRYGKHVRFWRKAPFGLHHLFYHASIKTEDHFVEQAAIARALWAVEMPLPDVGRAALQYDVPELSDDDWEWAENEVALMIKTRFVEAVPRAWNGEEWEFIDTRNDERQILCRYVWDDAAWDYRDEVVDEWHKVWQMPVYTGKVIEAHFDEPPTGNREWVPEREVVESIRDPETNNWRDVERTKPGFWAYPGETTRRWVERQEVGGAWVKGHWRDLTPEDRERKAVGLGRLTMPTVEAVKAAWIKSSQANDAEDMKAGPSLELVDGKMVITRKKPRTDAELEARWEEVRDQVMANEARVVAERDAEIAERLAALSSQPD